MKKGKMNLDEPRYSVGFVRRKTGIRATATLDSLEEYLSAPVVRDSKGWRRYSLRQISELSQLWRLRNPDRAVEA